MRIREYGLYSILPREHNQKWITLSLAFKVFTWLVRYASQTVNASSLLCWHKKSKRRKKINECGHTFILCRESLCALSPKSGCIGESARGSRHLHKISTTSRNTPPPCVEGFTASLRCICRRCNATQRAIAAQVD